MYLPPCHLPGSPATVPLSPQIITRTGAQPGSSVFPDLPHRFLGKRPYVVLALFRHQTNALRLVFQPEVTLTDGIETGDNQIGKLPLELSRQVNRAEKQQR